MFGGKASADQRKGPHAPSPKQASNGTRCRNYTLRTGLRTTTRQDNARRQGSPNGSCHRIRPPHGGRGERSPLRVRGNTDNGGLGLRISTPLFTQLCRVLLRRSSQNSSSETVWKIARGGFLISCVSCFKRARWDSFALYWLLARLQIEAYPDFPDFPDFPDSLSTYSGE